MHRRSWCRPRPCWQEAADAQAGLHKELGSEICSSIAEGSSLRAACDRLKLPRRTARDWLSKHADFERAYERARRLQVDTFVDEMLELADSVANCDSTAKVQAARLAIDTRKWIAAKVMPQRYGEQLAVTGADGRDLIPEETDPTRVALAVLSVIRAVAAEREAQKEADEAERGALPEAPSHEARPVLHPAIELTRSREAAELDSKRRAFRIGLDAASRPRAPREPAP
jgi:hypothetical protein